MSLDKAIEHGKEKRKPYRGAQLYFKSCRNHGDCPWCERKSCGNCIQCDKYYVNGKEHWACENYDKGCGMPVNVFPPNDEACSNWSDDPNDKDKPQDELRYFVDHFWDEVDD